ncbi:hypothetical protein B5M09_009088 [Aphanomyces astaci]|uniref:Uncharacterized protein n=1 Tax=Aphanomyces astaci TaxID=112090 RepID=A0A425CLF0_APHAT|nr:hypothetical protein B5M09_009088 [Aphanomyces astaci]
MRFWRHTVKEKVMVDPIRRAKNQTDRLINYQLAKLASITSHEVVVLTLGQGAYESQLKHLRRVYSALHQCGKSFEIENKQVRTQIESADVMARCLDALKEVVHGQAPVLHDTAEMAKVPNFSACTYHMNQVADTPGLLLRPDDQRNAIEKLALAILTKTKAVRTNISNLSIF